MPQRLKQGGKRTPGAQYTESPTTIIPIRAGAAGGSKASVGSSGGVSGVPVGGMPADRASRPGRQLGRVRRSYFHRRHAEKTDLSKEIYVML